jgi:hypothetical protein
MEMLLLKPFLHRNGGVGLKIWGNKLIQTILALLLIQSININHHWLALVKHALRRHLSFLIINLIDAL